MNFRFPLLLLLIPLLLSFTGGENNQGELFIKVEGIKKVQGRIGILLFNKEGGFPENAENAILNTKVEVTSKNMRINLGSLPFGKYAIAIVHDVNSNEEFDKNMLGIPKEPFGFSNNKSIFFGLPDFEEAAVQLNAAERETTIKLIDL